MPEDSSSKNLLVVEDDEATRLALTLFLQGEGYTVAVAENGQAALDHLRRSAPPSLILLGLPDVGDFRQAQRQHPALSAIPVVVLADLKLADCDRLGDVGFLQKPVDGDLLLAAIQRFSTCPKPTVLVIEDEDGVRKILDYALRHYGFGVVLASNGKEGIDLYRQQRDHIDLVLLDVQMPDLDGPATLVAIKRINPQVRCCFMSGSTGKYTTEELLGMGAAHVLMKPFASLSLFTRLLWDTACGRK